MLSQKNMQLLNWLLAGSHFQPSQPVEALLVISVLKSRKGLGKVHKGHQDDLTLMTWIHRLSNLSGKFPVEAHKQVQADEFSPPTSTRRTALLKPCLYLKSQSETSVTQFFPLLSAEFCWELPPQNKADLEVKQGGSELCLGKADPRQEEGQQQGDSIWSRKGMMPLPGTACWAVTSCLGLWGWFDVSTHSSGAALKFHLPVPRLLMFIVYPAGIDQYWCNPNSLVQRFHYQHQIYGFFKTSSIICHINYNRKLIFSTIFPGV